MADIISDGMVKVGWVTTLSSLTSPTQVQVTAGVDLESFLTPDGLGIELGDESVDVSALNSTFSAAKAGRGTVQIELTFKDQGVAAAPWTTFASRPLGYLVVRTGVAATTDWTAAQKIDIYTCQAGDRKLLAPAANEVAKFSVQLFSTTDPAVAVAMV
jgi:hypothetical protein